MECPKARAVTVCRVVAGQSGGDISKVKLKIFLRQNFREIMHMNLKTGMMYWWEEMIEED